jgi:aminoglycoside phosphotransferase (APT) family kinase protein
VVATSERVEAGWDRIEAVCAGMPTTLVHGDFRPKNLYLLRGAEGLVLLPIDWEYSGLGVPAVDLGALLRDHGRPEELAGYRAALAPELDEGRLWAWVCAGRVFRAVASMHWTRNSLAYPFVAKPVRNLVDFRAALERAFDALPDPARGGASP